MKTTNRSSLFTPTVHRLPCAGVSASAPTRRSAGATSIPIPAGPTEVILRPAPNPSPPSIHTRPSGPSASGLLIVMSDSDDSGPMCVVTPTSGACRPAPTAISPIPGALPWVQNRPLRSAIDCHPFRLKA